MGLFFNDLEEIKDKVYKDFGDTENHLVVMKYNDAKKGLAKLLASNLFYTLDSSRTFILYFNNKGINEEEISNSVKRDFLLMPWNEITSFNIDVKNDKALLNIVHLDKKIGYEIPFSGKIFSDNKANLKSLDLKEWNKIWLDFKITLEK